MTTKKIYGPWIKWNGGDCPVPPDTRVRVKRRYGSAAEDLAKTLYWFHDLDNNNILTYCTVMEQADLDAAEKLLLNHVLLNHGYDVTPPAKPLTFEDDLRHQPPLMTATEINALPHKAREYIHQLEANTDPSGMVRENMQLRDTNKGLQIMYRNRTDELDRVKQALEPLTFEGATPMTEAPKKGTWYWVIQPFNSRGVEAFAWGGDEYDLAVWWLHQGRLFASKEARNKYQDALVKLANGETK